ncbi:hypothetical protein AB0M28_20365 [Streptomyces sp. NPDC051940]|uniref:ATP-binding protein n=1 Tax=Streptomyces sp. NPDC051940 TaxID=3155675 RepID=UPI00342B9178
MDDALIGRTEEAAELGALLGAHRLVAVVGPAGVGKSVLAARAVAGGQFGKRPLWVQWPGTPTAADPAAALRAALLDPRPGRIDDAVARLGEWAGRREVGVYLDDIDPVHRGVVQLVHRVLDRLPGLRLLVTCRRPLGYGDEGVLRLGPLRHEPVGGQNATPAAQLFIRSARRARPTFTVDAATQRAVDDICRRLGGLPLAVELAARQLTALEVTELAGRLRHGQSWLADPAAPLARHGSLRQAMAAVYEQCDEPLRKVWSRASVFASSFSEAGASFLCSDEELTASVVPGCLTQLVAHGVLVPTADPRSCAAVRYRMTPAARDYGRESLTGAGEAEIAKERFFVHARQTASVANHLWSCGSQPQAVQLVRDELDNLRAVLDARPEQADHRVTALEIVVNVWFWWVVYDTDQAGHRYLRRLLPPDAPSCSADVNAHWLAAWLTGPTHAQDADALLSRAWPVAVLAGDSAASGRTAHVQGLIAWQRGDAEAAAQLFGDAAQAVPLHAPGGPSAAVSRTLLALVLAATRPARARQTARRVLTEPGVRGDTWACFLARYALAHLDHQAGRSARAWRRTHRMLADLDEQTPTSQGALVLHRLLDDIAAGRPATAQPVLPAVHGLLASSSPAPSAALA